MLAKQKWQVDTIKVLEAVFAEREQQVARYGHNEDLEDGTGPNTHWATAMGRSSLVEESFRREYLEYEAEHGQPTWMHLIREEVAEAFAEDDPDRLESELIQVAALCVSWVEKLRRRG